MKEAERKAWSAFLKTGVKEEMGAMRKGMSFEEKIRKWMLRCECKGEKFGPKKVITSLVVGSHCLYPWVTKIWILHQLFKLFQERITMHIEFMYWISTYFNPALAGMVTTIAEASLKIHFRVDLSILGLMLCWLECRLVSCEGRFFPLQCWWLGCQVSGAVTCCLQRGTCQMRCRYFSFTQKSY